MPIAAWSVHAFTAFGAYLGLIALSMIAQLRVKEALWCMFGAVIIDAIDGTFARLVRVKEKTPNFNGELLDNIVDFLNYVIVPLFMLVWLHLVPFVIEWPLAVLVIMASGYQFCQKDAKTSDNFFLGFPSYWNLIISFAVLFSIPEVTLSILIVVCALASFVPIKFIYPSRLENAFPTKSARTLFTAATLIFGASIVCAIISYPNPPQLVKLYVCGYSIAYLALGLLKSKSTQ